ncbi:hypothetical protein D7V97_35225 [Corallococcus sp. CA053C]|nr:hypothetical protein D7V97_35225 [Corallococcus sp. CA053C]
MTCSVEVFWCRKPTQRPSRSSSEPHSASCSARPMRVRRLGSATESPESSESRCGLLHRPVCHSSAPRASNSPRLSSAPSLQSRTAPPGS